MQSQVKYEYNNTALPRNVSKLISTAHHCILGRHADKGTSGWHHSSTKPMQQSKKT